jgi:hypothetical protein
VTGEFECSILFEHAARFNVAQGREQHACRHQKNHAIWPVLSPSFPVMSFTFSACRR